MFSNFIYFLTALVIYATSELFDKPAQFSLSVIGLFLANTVAFALVCRVYFRHLAAQAFHTRAASLDLRLNNAVSRLSILALILFAINIYGLRLNGLLLDFPLFQWMPTLGALIFMGLFLLYLVLIWNEAFEVQKRLFTGDVVTRNNFIFSNIAFCLPALLPWCCLSLLADVLALLPFEGVNRFFNSTAGEAVYIFVFVIAVAVFGPVFIHRLWRCRPLEPGFNRHRIERVCAMAGLKYKNILKWELFGGGMITAGVMGLVGKFRYILVTPALLTALDDDEIEGVILHEIGHVHNHHMLFYLFFFAGFIACNFVFFDPLMLVIYLIRPLYDGAEFLGVSQTSAHAAATCIVLIGLFVCYFRYIFGYFMRHFERQADLHIFKYQKTPSALISTFYKIASLSRQSIDKPNWHHFSIGQRIRFLESCRTSPGLIHAHHKKVKRMVAGYILGIGLLFILGYSISYGSLEKPFSRYAAGKILTRQLALDPDNSDLYVQVGDYYYDAQQYIKAKVAYENVIKIDPGNVHALNNLAWLLATCPRQELQDPVRSLSLAKQAVAIDAAPHILDTYAEALFANDFRKEALDTARQAFQKAKEKKQYYSDQVGRFEKALEKYMPGRF